MAQNTISDELNRLIQAKADIKSALEEKGLTIGDSSTLDEYPALIQEMEVGGGSSVDTSTLIDLIEGDIQQLIIPEGTTKMGGGAIYKQPNLQSITFPSTLTTINSYAIGGYTLTNLELNIPSTIETINLNAFYNSCIKTIIFNEDCSVIINQSGLTKVSNNTTGDPSVNTMILRGKISSDDTGFSFNKINNLIIDTSALIDRSLTKNGLFKASRINNLTILQGDTIYKNQFLDNRFTNGSIKILTNINNLGNSCFNNESGYNPNEVIFKSTIPNTIGTGYVFPKGNCPIYVPGAYLADYQANSSLSTFSARFKPLASMSYDASTYTVTALGRDNLELYVDASLCDSSVYTFPVDNRNHTIEVKSVDPSFGLLDSSTMTVYIGEPQYMALTCSDPNGATVSMTQTLGDNSGVNVVDMKYSTDGVNWNNWTHTDVTENDSTTYTFNTISLNEGDKVYFKGDNSTGLGYTTSDTGNARFVFNGNLGASGNVMSLLYDDDFQEYNSVPINGLSNLFNGCTSLTTAPELPATTLGANCYRNMFYGCTSLTTAPELPAITLGNWCYSRMFYGCTSLNYVKAMFTAQDAATHTQQWLNNVSATGTFVKNPEALWSESDIIPSGWIVEPFDYTLTPQTYQAVIPAANQGYAQGVVTINADDYNNNDYVLATKISGWPPYDQNGQSTDEGEITPIKITLYEAPTGTMTLSNGYGATQGSLTQDANNPLIYWYNITDNQKAQEFDIMLDTANAKFKVSKVEFNYNEFSE